MKSKEEHGLHKGGACSGYFFQEPAPMRIASSVMSLTLVIPPPRSFPEHQGRCLALHRALRVQCEPFLGEPRWRPVRMEEHPNHLGSGSQQGRRWVSGGSELFIKLSQVMPLVDGTAVRLELSGSKIHPFLLCKMTTLTWGIQLHAQPFLLTWTFTHACLHLFNTYCWVSAARGCVLESWVR
jgi:hypothetical protein